MGTAHCHYRISVAIKSDPTHVDSTLNLRTNTRLYRSRRRATQSRANDARISCLVLVSWFHVGLNTGMVNEPFNNLLRVIIKLLITSEVDERFRGQFEGGPLDN